MTEAAASPKSPPANGQPVQTSAIDYASTETKVDSTSPQAADTISSLSGQWILSFLETVDNGTLVVILGASALLIYLIFGRLGILLIGLLSGFLFHDYRAGLIADKAAGDGGDGVGLYSFRRRRELGIEVASRLLDWKPQSDVVRTDQEKAAAAKANEDAATLDLSKFPPATAAALTELIDAMMDGYVLHWYKPILPSDDSFPLSCRKIIVGFVNSLSTHMTRKRSADTFLQFVTNSSSMIIVFLNELSLALQETASDSTSTEDHVRQYLTKYPNSNLANVLSKDQQQKKMTMVADDLLSNFLEPSFYNCETVRNFLRGIFAGVVLESVVKSCSQPDSINGWIVYLLREGEPQIMNAIDAGLESASKGEIAALSGIAGNTSQDLTESVKGKQGPFPIQDAPGLPKLNSDGSILLKDISKDKTTGAISSRSSPGATPSSSIEKLPKEDRGEAPQRLLDIVNQEHSLGGTTNISNQEEVEDAVQILYGASVTVDDGSVPGDKTTMKAKPTTEYMLQIEPASTRYPGWMIFRKYQDFEYLHAGLATLARYHHAPFIDIHPVLPPYRDQTKSSLAKALERYLRDALEHRDLAKSERLRKFLDKDNDFGQMSPTSGKGGFNLRASSTFENMGKNMLGVLSNAPKGVAGGGKAMLDGVTGVLSGVNRNRRSVDTTPRDSKNSPASGSNVALNAIRERSPDTTSLGSSQDLGSPIRIDQHGDELSNGAGAVETPMTDAKYQDSMANKATAQSAQDGQNDSTSPKSSPTSSVRTPSPEKDNAKPETLYEPTQAQDISANPVIMRKESTHYPRTKPSENPINEEETRVAVELIFAVINELYTLSSAWTIRKTLLNAAKTYILRPGNLHLESIRVLVQDSMIDSNTTDEAIAAKLTKIRENALPTEEEMKAWPPPLSKEESENLKNEARKLLIERGMPQVLMSVMGAAASREALGKVFDCLQVEEVGRGFMFALILQALRAVIL
ncbi:PX domain protein [Talaromyces stipitatus ATCC 10500]|uniref:PX domain protein n=1 Tax=Talaromyces stipitatus (strain ATCC 10500 / CBS 375.48 / QM 6759 / NRRL 1006) TaxID=441959 RepID=B8M0Y9_TALSN|nr:PX domain protein [Talaromyces stipitatus ATCC 10500]EED21769.1 PX domain protein [Talaromyces stipitatus ATCC 10500]